jgi:hypothetical protein
MNALKHVSTLYLILFIFINYLIIAQKFKLHQIKSNLNYDLKFKIQSVIDDGLVGLICYALCVLYIWICVIYMWSCVIYVNFSYIIIFVI